MCHIAFCMADRPMDKSACASLRISSPRSPRIGSYVHLRIAQ